jgi:hypothetical protein
MEPLTNNAPLIPSGDNVDSSQVEEKFPVSLPEGLTAAQVKEKTKNYKKIWEPFFKKKSQDLETFQKMFYAQPTGPQKSKATVVLPVAPGIIETSASRIDKAVWGRDKLVDVMPLDPNVSKEQAQVVEDFINQELIYVSRGTKKGKSLIKSALIDGVGLWREKWNVKREVRTSPNYQSPSPMMPPMYVGENPPQEIEYGCWDWVEGDPSRFMFDPMATTSIAESPWLGIRDYMSLSELKKWEQMGKIQNVDAIAQITPSGIANKDDWESKRRNAIGNGMSSFEYADYKEYKVDEWHGNITWEVNQEGTDAEGKPLPKKVMSEDFHWIMVEEDVLILFEPLDLMPKRIPAGSFPILIDPRKVYGKSALHDVRGVQEMLNNFAGKQADLVAQAADRPVYYDKSSGLSGRTAFQRTQGLIPVDNVNGIKFGEINTQAIAANQNFIQFLIEFSRQITAANEQAQGISGGAQTATEFAGLVQLIGARFDDIVDNIIQFCCVPQGQGCLDYYQQFGVDGQMVVRESSIDGSSKMVTRQMLQGRWQIVPSGANAQANKEARIKSAIEVMKMLIELANQSTANPMLLNGFMPDIKRYVDEVLAPVMDLRQSNNLWTQAPPPMAPGLPAMGPTGGPPPPIGGPDMGPVGPSPQQMGMGPQG